MRAVWFHLKFASLLSVAWVVLLLVRPGAGARDLVAYLTLPGALLLAFVHGALAALFWWGSFDPPRRLVAVFTGLGVFAVRSVLGIYLVLYRAEGAAAMVLLVEMVLSIGLLSAFINGLPAALRPRD